MMAQKPPLATIAARLFCVNPAGVFFSAAYSESLFAMLTFAGHAFVARGRYFDRLLRSEGGGGRRCERGIMGGRSGGCGALLMEVGKLLLAIVALLPSSLPILHNYGRWRWIMEAVVDDDGCGGGVGRRLWWRWTTAVVDDDGG
jgi:hypothetical protein